MKGKPVLLNVLILVLLLVLATANGAKAEIKMYWTDAGTTNKIQRANLDGSEVQNLVTGLDGPTGIALDTLGGKMYWTEAGTTRKIKRANLNGTEIEDLVVGLDGPTGIALDMLGGKMYWTDVGKFTSNIKRANLDGTSVEDLVTGLGDPQGIALDTPGGKMYWTDAGTTERANLDGTGVEELVIRLEAPRGIALDITGGKMYWIDAGTTNKIQRANLDGTGIEDIVTGLEAPHGIALDIVDGKVYWVSAGTAQNVQRANLDGTGVEDLVTGLDMPSAIALALETEAFTYQGRLIDANSSAYGFYDFQFKLFDDPCDGNQLGDSAYKPDVDVVDGYFTVELVFDARIFTVQGLWLGIDVRPGDSNDVYTTLSPRQEITPVPYALHTLHTHGLSVGEKNTFVGIDAGYSNTTGKGNTFLGNRAGRSNSTGYDNTFLGHWAGYSNQTGSGNVFIGYQAGYHEIGSNKLIIANSAGGTLIYGDFEGNIVTIDGALRIWEKLDVGGNVKANSLVYSSPRTHYFVVGGEDFVPATDVAYQNSGATIDMGTGGAFIESGRNTLVAPVHLPQGAVVSEFKVFFNDNSTRDISVYLHRLNLTDGSYYMMAYVSSSGISGYGNKTDTTISEAPIDNTIYAYSVNAFSMSWDGSNMRIMGAVITYTISEAP